MSNACSDDNASVGCFYGVYLLCSQSIVKRYKGKCYIGFTTNPNRRIKQHNSGIDFGGARKTNNKGPWQMVLIVHGFPNNISALQFEWAWQQPALSTRLKPFPELQRKQPKEQHFAYNFRILNRMLMLGPWNRLPLTIRWLEKNYEMDFIPNSLPEHMKIVSGKITLIKEPTLKDTEQPRAIWAPECHICMQNITDPMRSRIGCLNALCKLTCHLICLANYLLTTDERNRGHFIPISGACPLCETELTWIELLQRKRKIIGLPEVEDAGEYNSDTDFLDFDKESSEEVESEISINTNDNEVFELSD